MEEEGHVRRDEKSYGKEWTSKRGICDSRRREREKFSVHNMTGGLFRIGIANIFSIKLFILPQTPVLYLKGAELSSFDEISYRFKNNEILLINEDHLN